MMSNNRALCRRMAASQGFTHLPLGTELSHSLSPVLLSPPIPSLCSPPPPPFSAAPFHPSVYPWWKLAPSPQLQWKLYAQERASCHPDSLTVRAHFLKNGILLTKRDGKNINVYLHVEKNNTTSMALIHHTLLFSEK